MTVSVQIKTDYALLAINKVNHWLEIILTARNKIVTELINHDIAKIEHQMPLAQARALKIAHPTFEYDPIVRVVEFPTATYDLCGGTHVNNLQEIYFLEIWDCWFYKKKVRMQLSTNKIETQKYFTNWINQKKDSLQQSIKKLLVMIPHFILQFLIFQSQQHSLKKII